MELRVAPPEGGDRREKVLARRGGRREVAQEREVALEGVEEVREGARADVEDRLDGEVALDLVGLGGREAALRLERLLERRQLVLGFRDGRLGADEAQERRRCGVVRVLCGRRV